MSNTIIEARDVSFRYDGAAEDAVSHVSLTVSRGEFVAVLGRNGSGKSTFAKLLNALLLPTGGKLTVDGLQPASEDDCYDVRRTCGMVFQNPDNQIVTTIVEEDCAFGLENLGVAPAEIRRRVDEVLAAVGMAEFAKASPSMLSGGQKQRIAVAGVLAMRPKIIVFDESTAMLDPVGRRDVFALARKLNREEGITVVWITHFREEATQADRVLVMDHGQIALQGAPRQVFSQVDRVLALRLDVPEMMKLAARLRASGLKLTGQPMTVGEMTEELIRLRALPQGDRMVRVGAARSPQGGVRAKAAPEEGEAVIELDHLTHVYMPGTPFEARALNEVSLSVREGEFIGLIGHTGSGKSTLITYLTGLSRAQPGIVRVNGVDLGAKDADLIAMRRTVGLVFQYPEYQLFEETAAKDIAFGPTNLGLSREEIDRRVVHAMNQVGLDAIKGQKSPFEMSGGQKRRVAIAGVLAMEPSSLVLDEPATGLDPAGRYEMLELIRDIHESGVTVVMVSHSMDDVGRYCDRLFVLNHGEIAFSGTPAEVFLHGEALNAIGLDVPECAKLAGRLREVGFDMPEAIYRMEDVAGAILENLGKGGNTDA